MHGNTIFTWEPNGLIGGNHFQSRTTQKASPPISDDLVCHSGKSTRNKHFISKGSVLCDSESSFISLFTPGVFLHCDRSKCPQFNKEKKKGLWGTTAWSIYSWCFSICPYLPLFIRTFVGHIFPYNEEMANAMFFIHISWTSRQQKIQIYSIFHLTLQRE